MEKKLFSSMQLVLLEILEVIYVSDDCPVFFFVEIIVTVRVENLVENNGWLDGFVRISVRSREG